MNATRRMARRVAQASAKVIGVKKAFMYVLALAPVLGSAAIYGQKWTVDHQLSSFGTHTGATACLPDGTFVVVAHQWNASFQDELVVRGYTKDGAIAFTHNFIAANLDGSATGEPIVKVDRLGNIYILGNVGSVDSADILLLKFNKNGLVWSRQHDFAGSSWDQRGNLDLDTSGNPIIVMWSKARIAVTRYSKDGQLLYRSAYGGPINGTNQGTPASQQIYYDANRNAMVTGQYKQDLVVFKLGPTGVRLWSRVLSWSPGYPAIKFSNILPDGSLILYVKYNDYAEVVKVKPDGNLDWVKTPPTGDYHSSVLQKGGNWILFGRDWVNNQYLYRAVAYTPAGAIAWHKTFSLPPSFFPDYQQDRPEMIVSLDAFDDIYLTIPTILQPSDEDVRYYTLKFASYGGTRWTHMYDPAGIANRATANVINPVTGDLLVVGQSTNRTFDAIKAICYRQSVQPTKETYSMPRNTTLSPPKSVLWNDRYAAEATASVIVQPQHGTVQMNALGYFSYTPTTGYVGPDTFTYRATKTGVDPAQAVVTLNVQ